MVHSEIDHQSGSLLNYYAQTPHVKADASPSSSTSTLLYPLNDLMSVMKLLDCPGPLDSSLHEGSFHKPSSMPCQSYHSVDSSSASFSSNHGSFSGHRFQYGQHSFNTNDNMCSGSLQAQIASQDYEKLEIVSFGSSAMSLRVVLLHGTRDVWVYEAKNLPNKDLFSENLRQVMTKAVPGKLSAKKQ